MINQNVEFPLALQPLIQPMVNRFPFGLPITCWLITEPELSWEYQPMTFEIFPSLGNMNYPFNGLLKLQEAMSISMTVKPGQVQAP